MTKYNVDLQVGVSGIAYFTVTVEAENENEARELAEEESVAVHELEDVRIDEIHSPWYIETVTESDAA